TYDRIGEVLVNQLRAAGITMKTEKVDYTAFNSQWNGGKLQDASVTGYAAIGFDANTWFYNQLYSKSPGERWQIKDAQIDEWAQQQEVELDPNKRKAIQKKIRDRDLDVVYRPPMPLGATLEIYQPRLRGIRFG